MRKMHKPSERRAGCERCAVDVVSVSLEIAGKQERMDKGELDVGGRSFGVETGEYYVDFLRKYNELLK